MRSLKDDEGASLKIRPNLLVVPPALEDDANYLMTAEKFPDGTPNPYRNTAEVLVMPELASDSAWFLFDTTKPVKPLIYQLRKSRFLWSRRTITATTCSNVRSSCLVLKRAVTAVTASGRWHLVLMVRRSNAWKR